jgi:hypothetical protein
MRNAAIRPIAVAGAALCATAIAGLGSADGHRFNAPASIQIVDGGATGAEGKVITPRAACRVNRTVTLFKREGTRRTPMGTGTTDADGNWSVHSNLTAGFYQATVAPKGLRRSATTARKRRHLHHCQGAISRVARL